MGRVGAAGARNIPTHAAYKVYADEPPEADNAPLGPGARGPDTYRA